MENLSTENEKKLKKILNDASFFKKIAQKAQKADSKSELKKWFSSDKHHIISESSIPTFTNKTIKNTQNIINKINLSLDFSNKNLSKLPNFFSNFDFIEILDISNNKIKVFPLEILTANKLKCLKINHNFISSLPPNLFSLHLENFYISNNLLEEIPNEIANCKNSLKILDISFNQIKELNPTIFELIHIQALFINNNPFTRFPTKIFQMTNLEILSFDWFKYTNPMKKMLQVKNYLKNFLSICKSTFFLGFELIDFFEFKKKFSFTPTNEVFLNENNQTILHIAAKDEDIGVLLSILEQENQKKISKYIFCFKIRKNCENCLLKSKNECIINSIDNENHTALSLAISEEKYYSAKILLFNNSDPNIGGGQFNSCLTMSIIKTQYYLIKDLLKIGANPNKCDNEGNTPLHYLFNIYNNNDDICKEIFDILLLNGANPNLLNHEKWAPIHLAIFKSQINILKAIFDYNLKNFHFFKRKSDSVCKFDKKIFNRKKLFPFNIYLKGGNEGYSPIHLAVINKNHLVLEVFLQNNVSTEIFDKQGKTAIDYCDRKKSIQESLEKLKERQNSQLSLKNIRSTLSNSKLQKLNMSLEEKSNKKKSVKSNINYNDNFSDFCFSQSSSFDSEENEIEFDDDLMENNKIQEKIENRKMIILPLNLKKIEKFQKYCNNYYKNFESPKQNFNNSINIPNKNILLQSYDERIANIPDYNLTRKYKKPNKKISKMSFLPMTLRKSNIDYDEISFYKNNTFSYFNGNLQIFCKKLTYDIQTFKEEINLYKNEIEKISDKFNIFLKLYEIHCKLQKIIYILKSSDISLRILNANLFESSKEIVKEKFKENNTEIVLSLFSSLLLKTAFTDEETILFGIIGAISQNFYNSSSKQINKFKSKNKLMSYELFHCKTNLKNGKNYFRLIYKQYDL